MEQQQQQKNWVSETTVKVEFIIIEMLEKEMATHSSVLAWRIPGMGEPGGLQSMGSHRVGHDWSDLAAAVTINIQLKTSQGGTLSAPFWCLCQKLSLSPLYFNKTLLHTHTQIIEMCFKTHHFYLLLIIWGDIFTSLSFYFPICWTELIITF